MSFHAHSGWFFERLTEDGDVQITKMKDGSVEAEGVFDSATWASIVASVSPSGDTGETWRAALQLHQKVVLPA